MEFPMKESDGHQWFKGNLHMHSLWSDGNDFPEMVADWFKQNGYHFIAFTEHEKHQVGEQWFRGDEETGQGRAVAEGDFLAKYRQRFGDHWVQQQQVDGKNEVRLKPLAEYRHLCEEAGRFLIMTGEEVTTTWGAATPQHTHWINVFNTAQALGRRHSEVGSQEAMGLTFAAAQEAADQCQGEVLAFLNHANFLWNTTAEDIAAVPELSHMEMYTALDMVYTYGDERRASVERIWDVVTTLRLSRGEPLVYGLATDDCHAYAHHWQFGNGALPGRAWIVVRSRYLTPEHILSAIRRGDFYCSSGVELTGLKMDAEGIHLKIDAQPNIEYTTRFIGTRRGCDLTAQPVLDAEGNELRTTQHYGDELGCLLAEVKGTTASYTFVGDELYVRAAISSTAAHPKPTLPGEVQKAWTQPVHPRS